MGIKREKIIGFIQEAEKIDELRKKNIEVRTANGIFGSFGNMPPEMETWMNKIKMFNERNLTDHPLYTEINTVCFQNSGRIRDFHKMFGLLKAIASDDEDFFTFLESKKNQFTSDIDEDQLDGLRGDSLKTSKIFISHSSNDIEYVEAIIGFLENLGFSTDEIICSSIPGYGIPINEDIYGYLKEQFSKHNLHIFFILSKNYYQSAPCLNEMGAAWVLQNKYTTILLPGFKFEEIKGAVNPRQIGLKLDNSSSDLKVKLEELKDILTVEFSLKRISSLKWEGKRDEFIDKINSLSQNSHNS